MHALDLLAASVESAAYRGMSICGRTAPYGAHRAGGTAQSGCIRS